MNELYTVLGWGSPIGTGLFLTFLGIFILCLALAGKYGKK